MTHSFDKDYWETHWREAVLSRADAQIAPNPYLPAELDGLVPGTALEAGCGEGAEAIWLAAAGWQVTAVDISGAALAHAAQRADSGGAFADRLRWVEADLGSWQPDGRFDLVTTHYAHPAMPQLAFYQRISEWVAPGGTLLIVGHLHTADASEDDHGHRHGHQDRGTHRPVEATVTAAEVTAVLDRARWDIATAREPERGIGDEVGPAVHLRDVVVRANRRN